MKSSAAISEERTSTALRKAIIPEPPKRNPVMSALYSARVWLVLVVGILGWALIVRLSSIPHFLLPGPDSVVETFLEAPGFYMEEFLVTSIEAVSGFAIAASIAFVLAIIMARSSLLEDLIYPYLNILRVMPIIAIAPLLIIWFGHGMTPMIIVSAMIAFFPIVVNTVLGLRSADPELIDLMHTWNASEGEILRKIRLPTALPYLLSSFRIAAPLAVIGAMVGEFVGGTGGLGYLLLRAHGRIDTSGVFLMVALSVFLSLFFFGLVVAIERRVLRWHPSILNEQL